MRIIHIEIRSNVICIVCTFVTLLYVILWMKPIGKSKSIVFSHFLASQPRMRFGLLNYFLPFLPHQQFPPTSYFHYLHILFIFSVNQSFPSSYSKLSAFHSIYLYIYIQYISIKTALQLQIMNILKNRINVKNRTEAVNQYYKSRNMSIAYR